MGEKSENERFAGAENTYTIECMMQDGKALQSCTSHYLGQNFGKAFDVQFLTKENTKEYAYATSRGISTRALGGMIMSHSDDKGLVLPPAIAPIHVVIVPFFKTEDELKTIAEYIRPIREKIINQNMKIKLLSELNQIESNILSIDDKLLQKTYYMPIKHKFDIDSEKSPGWKFNEYELQ